MLPDLKILQGDCLEMLRTLPDESAHCVVTSPPYWGLRDYGTGQWEGGSLDCDHKKASQGKPTWGPGSTKSSTLNGRPTNDNHEQEAHYRDVCAKCGARRVDRQIGLEKTPEEYVAKMVEVFREVRRVLRSDGTCWINLGSSYAQSGMGGNPNESPYQKQATNAGSLIEGRKPPEGFKPKDMIPIPWMVAMALQADGWWLRQDIIWHKPNPMPESVTDRCTKSHEYIFLLAKAERYFYDAEAIKEKADEEIRYAKTFRHGKYVNNSTFNNSGSMGPGEDGYAELPGVYGRNKRSVWTVPSYAFPEAHFATYPPDLIKPCILAGTSARGCCPKCGAPWERVVQSESLNPRDYNGKNSALDSQASARRMLANLRASREAGYGDSFPPKQTLGWQPQCRHREDIRSIIPCTILDPFAGSFTTCAVALELGRSAIGIELNPTYVEMGRKRCAVTPGLAL